MHGTSPKYLHLFLEKNEPVRGSFSVPGSNALSLVVVFGHRWRLQISHKARDHQIKGGGLCLSFQSFTRERSCLPLPSLLFFFLPSLFLSSPPFFHPSLLSSFLHYFWRSRTMTSVNDLFVPHLSKWAHPARAKRHVNLSQTRIN